MSEPQNPAGGEADPHAVGSERAERPLDQPEVLGREERGGERGGHG